MKKSKSLQWQITTIVALILIVTCVILTVNSIYSAGTYYGDWAEVYQEAEGFDLKTENEAIDGNTVKEDNVTFMEVMREFSRQGVFVMFLVIIISLLLVYWLTGKKMNPLRRLTADMQAIDEKTMNRSVEGCGGSAEVEQLSASFNGLMLRLDEAFQAQKRFSANAAHELKTPLAAVKTSLQVLEMEDNPSKEEYLEFVQDVRCSLDRLISTVDHLMMLSGKENKNVREAVPLRELLDQGVQQLKDKADAMEVAIEIVGPPLTVMGNKELFYRGLYNLIDNAIKYNKKQGHVQITMGTEEDKSFVSIEDTGIGMDQQSQQRVFEPFFRADESRSQEIPGSGLGMSLVKQIFDTYDGEIEMESRKGEGTKVKILFQR